MGLSLSGQVCSRGLRAASRPGKGRNEARVGHRSRRRLKIIPAKVSKVTTSIAEQSISVGKDTARLTSYLRTAARYGIETCCKLTFIKCQFHPCVRGGNRGYSRRRTFTSQSTPFHVDAKPADGMVGLSVLLSRQVVHSGIQIGKLYVGKQVVFLVSGRTSHVNVPLTPTIDRGGSVISQSWYRYSGHL